jgi:DNA-binding NtrC family response regulator
MSAQGESKTVLVVSPFGEDQLAGSLREVFRHSLFRDFNWRMQEAHSCREALEYLRRNFIPVVISWCDLRDVKWKDLWKHLLRQIALLVHPPLLIVSYQPVSHCFWSEVLNLGGYDVLVKPFEPWDVFRLLSLAWEHWRDRASLRSTYPRKIR